MIPPDDPVIIRFIAERYKDIPWYGVLGIFGVYIFFGLVVIPAFSYFEFAVEFAVTKAIIAAPYISALVFLAVGYIFYSVFPKEVSVIEGITGIIGVLYQINSMSGSGDMNTILGMLGSGFMAIHAFHKIYEIKASKENSAAAQNHRS
jgi:hypothetical protein